MAAGSYHAITVSFNNSGGGPASLRLAYNRAQGDIDDAAAAARTKRMAIVFLNDANATTTTANPYASGPASISAPQSLSAANTNLIEAVAAANPNTVVVLNTTNPVLLPWRDAVKSVLEMWFAGQEGGTSTARLLLGQATPSGHTSLSWPAHSTDTLWAFNQPFGLYPGDTAGPHLERLNYDYGAGSNQACVNPAAPAPNNTVCTNETEGIFTGYKYLDQMAIAPMFPFGYGLSYTTFKFSNLSITPSAHEADVTFDVTNTGARAGAEVAQVYLGPGPDVAGAQQAVRSLQGFNRVALAAGETRRVTVHLPERAFQYWDEFSQSWKTN